MNKNPTRRLMLLLDLAIIIMEIFALGTSLAQSGGKMFRYYTQNSNLLALIVCVVCMIGEMRGRPKPGLRYLSACCLGLTLVMAGTILVHVEPGTSFYGFMLEGKYLYLHTLCPLLVIVRLLLQRGPGYGERHALLALIPTCAYGAVSLVMNACGVYSGPYPFLRVMDQPGYATAVGCIAVLAVNYAVARLLALATSRRG